MLSMDQFIQVCREKGLNVTYQRMIIYKYLMQSKEHPTAEDIYRRVKEEYPSISLATVYKTLETLAEHQVITKVTALHDLARYDADTSPHHHLVCIHCRRVQDIYNEELNKLPIDLDAIPDFKVQRYRIEFEGICSQCQANLQKKQRA